MNKNTNNAAAWDAGYSAGRAAKGSKALVESPYESEEMTQAFFKGFGVGFNDFLSSAKTGNALNNPYV